MSKDSFQDRDKVLDHLTNSGVNPCLKMALELYDIDILNGLDTLKKFEDVAKMLSLPLDRQIVEEGLGKAKALSDKFLSLRKNEQKKQTGEQTTLEFATFLKKRRIATCRSLIKKGDVTMSFFTPKTGADERVDLGVSTHHLSSPSPVKVNLQSQFSREYITTKEDRKGFLEELEISLAMESFSNVEMEEAEAALLESNKISSSKYTFDKEKVALKRLFRMTCAYLIKNAKKDADMFKPPIRLTDQSFDWEEEHALKIEHHESLEVCSEEFKNLMDQHRAPYSQENKAGFLARRYEKEVLRYEWICLLFKTNSETEAKVSQFKTNLATKLETSFSPHERVLTQMSRSTEMSGGAHRFDYFKQHLSYCGLTSPRRETVYRGNINKVSFQQNDDHIDASDSGVEEEDSQNEMFLTTGEDGAPLTKIFVVGQSPISKDPNGRAVREERTDKVQKTHKTKSYWKKGDGNSSETEQKGKRKRDESDSEEEEEKPKPKKVAPNSSRQTRSGNATSAQQAQTKILRMVEDLTKKVEHIASDKEKPQSQNDSRNSSRYDPKPPRDACMRKLNGEWCNDVRCTKNHGKFVTKDREGNVKKFCGSYERKEPCRYLYGPNGCYFNHHVKNYRGTR